MLIKTFTWAEPHFFSSFNVAYVYWSCCRRKCWMQGSLQPLRAACWPQPSSQRSRLWAEGLALVAAAACIQLLHGPETPNTSLGLWATPRFGLKSRLCKNCFLLPPPPLQARSSVLTEPAGCAVAHLHGSSGASWIWCTCWEWLYPACAKTVTQEGKEW